MIIDGLLFIIQKIVYVLLLPLTPLNFAFNSILGITYVADFIKIVTYVLPWNNLRPLIIFIVAMFIFRIIVSLIKTIWDLLPVL